MKKTLALLLVIVISMGMLCGCGQGEQSKQDTTRVITDMAGREVEIPNNIERVACQSSTCEAVIISLGKATLLVGTTDYTDENSFAFKLFPELSEVTKLDDDMSVEEMLKNDVQVVFVKDTNKIEKYEEAGIPVIYVELDTVEGTKEGIKIIGDVINAQSQAENCVNYIINCENMVKERINSTPFTAYYSRAKYAESNLLTTYAAGHIYSEWIAASGGSVITKDMELAETKGGVVINGEELVNSNPDVIFIGGYYRNSVYNEAMSGEYNTVLKAISNNKVFMVPTSVTDWSVGACELGLTILWCAQMVAPEQFEDINMTEQLVSFYKSVAGVTVTEELANDILNSNIH